jgi:hypothetical protein
MDVGNAHRHAGTKACLEAIATSHPALWCKIYLNLAFHCMHLTDHNYSIDRDLRSDFPRKLLCDMEDLLFPPLKLQDLQRDAIA